MSIQSLKADAGKMVTFHARASRCRDRKKADGQHFQILQLDDATGTLEAMLWPSAATSIGQLPNFPCYVEVIGKLRWFNGALIMDVHSLREIEAGNIRSDTLLMPKRLCPDIALPALRDMAAFQQLIENAYLKEFVSRVLHDEQLVSSFLTSPASRQHHHAFAGGLLMHSAGPLGLVKTLAEEKFQDSDTIEVTQVAYLFHDLGKVLAMQRGISDQKVLFLRHEFLTGCILGPHLDWLSSKSPRLASTLIYIFDYLDQPKESRRRASFAGADIVVWVDQHNASLVAGRGMECADAEPLISDRTTNATYPEPRHGRFLR